MFSAYVALFCQTDNDLICC